MWPLNGDGKPGAFGSPCAKNARHYTAVHVDRAQWGLDVNSGSVSIRSEIKRGRTDLAHVIHGTPPVVHVRVQLRAMPD